MELNREQIIKALECLWYEKECVGDECPLFKLGGDCAPLIAMEALSLIKELTEENEAWQKQLISTEEKSGKAYYELACEVEDLRAENERLHATCTELERKCASLNDENEGLRAENDARLPIKVGQTVYVPWRYAFQQAIATVKVEEIKFYDSQMHYMFLIDMESDNECFNQSFGGWKTDKSIGTTVFLTKEEAKKSIERRMICQDILMQMR